MKDDEEHKHSKKSMRNMSKNKLFLGNFITKGEVQKDD